MKVLIQRVNSAKVVVEDQIVGAIQKGLLLYICFEISDQEANLDAAVSNLTHLRIFEDEKERMHFSLQDTQYEVLSVSQFTLSWDGSRGHRPSFDKSMPPNQARLMYALFNKKLRDHGISVSEGKFGANMQVYSENDGPVTFFLSF